MKSVNTRFWDKVRIPSKDDCWEWTGHRNHGYGVFKVRIGPYKRRYFRASRFAWAFFNGEIPLGLSACHRCDNPACVNPSHIFLGTHADNMMDKVSKSRQPMGEQQPASKLSDAKVRQARFDFESGIATAYQLAARYGVDVTAIRMALRRKSWKHVP